MAHVIAVANRKGGCGKTTIALNLAGAYAADGIETLVVDADPQGSAMHWREARGDSQGPLGVVQIAAPVLHREIPKLASKYSLVVIDCPPGGEEISRSALVVAELALVPVQPSAFDLWGGVDIAEVIAKAAASNPRLQALCVISRRMAGTNLGRDARDGASVLGIAVCRSEITHRIVLVEAALAGRTIQEYDPGSRSVQEFRALSKEIMKCLRK